MRLSKSEIRSWKRKNLRRFCSIFETEPNTFSNAIIITNSSFNTRTTTFVVRWQKKHKTCTISLRKLGTWRDEWWIWVTCFPFPARIYFLCCAGVVRKDEEINHVFRIFCVLREKLFLLFSFFQEFLIVFFSLCLLATRCDLDFHLSMTRCKLPGFFFFNLAHFSFFHAHNMHRTCLKTDEFNNSSLRL